MTTHTHEYTTHICTVERKNVVRTNCSFFFVVFFLDKIGRLLMLEMMTGLSLMVIACPHP